MGVDKRRTRNQRDYVFTYYEAFDTATVPYQRLSVSVHLESLKQEIENVLGHKVTWRVRLDGTIISGTRYIITPRDAYRKQREDWDG